MSEADPASAQPSSLIRRRSRYAFADTVTRLTSGISAAGLTLFATIDQRAAAQTVGLSLRPTTLLIFGNPKGGTPLMDAHPEFAVELPLKLIVWEASGDVDVAYVRPSLAALRYGIGGDDPRLIAMDRVLENLTTAIAEIE